jgi:hypothetical protein
MILTPFLRAGAFVFSRRPGASPTAPGNDEEKGAPAFELRAVIGADQTLASEAWSTTVQGSGLSPSVSREALWCTLGEALTVVVHGSL